MAASATVVVAKEETGTCHTSRHEMESLATFCVTEGFACTLMALCRGVEPTILRAIGEEVGTSVKSNFSELSLFIIQALSVSIIGR